MSIILIISALFCQWIAYSPEELNYEPQNLMLGNVQDMHLEVTCGGTAHIKIEFDTFYYCRQKNILKAKGVVKDRQTEELYPFCSIANAEVKGKIVLKSEVMQTDIDGNFSIEIEFQKDDKLLFYDVGTELVLVSMTKK